MGRLIYSTIMSLDGYVEDADGNFDWARPDDELFAFINDLERPIGTYLYGRRMYETMVFWEPCSRCSRAGCCGAGLCRDLARRSEGRLLAEVGGGHRAPRRDLNGRSSLLRSVE